ncbi:MAG: ArsR family transcriptional regulator [Halobacteria archaeon]|nr:ArsR family transcriptional regulator [Halobacteria archaeon]
MNDAEFEERLRDLPCDAKLAYVVLEKRGPFTENEVSEETYLSEDETVYALAVLEEKDLVLEHQHPDSDETIYEAKKR